MPYAVLAATDWGQGLDAVFAIFSHLMESMGTAMATLIQQPLFLLGVAGGLVFTIIRVVKKVTRG